MWEWSQHAITLTAVGKLTEFIYTQKDSDVVSWKLKEVEVVKWVSGKIEKSFVRKERKEGSLAKNCLADIILRNQLFETLTAVQKYSISKSNYT